MEDSEFEALSKRNDLLGTDLDYFQGEITSLKKQLKAFAANFNQNGDSDPNHMIEAKDTHDLYDNFKKALEISSILAHHSKNWFAEIKELHL